MRSAWPAARPAFLFGGDACQPEVAALASCNESARQNRTEQKEKEAAAAAVAGADSAGCASNARPGPLLRCTVLAHSQGKQPQRWQLLV